MRLLPAGDYRFEAASAGFALAEYHIHLEPGGAYRLELGVALPTANQINTVVAESSSIETARSQIAATVQTEEAQQLPLNGRNYLDLALLLPGVSQTNTASSQVFAGDERGAGAGLLCEQPA